MTNPVLELACELIARRSITPHDDGCQAIVAERLEALEFKTESLQFDDVTNLWAVRGNTRPLFVFAGHTDVVPTGDLASWNSDPFVPTVINERLYGRGAADMKSSIAAMVVAAEQFVRRHPNHAGTIAFLITSDEEGDAVNGTAKVVEELMHREQTIDWCLVGEPSSSNDIGDVVRVGRRGSLNGQLELRGTLGHVAYPEQTPNPVHAAAALFSELSRHHWDEGNDYFPPTSFQVSNFNAGTGAQNVIPDVVGVSFNFRFNTLQSPESLQNFVAQQLTDLHPDLQTKLEWRLSGLPFLSAQAELTEAIVAAIRDVIGRTPEKSTSGGTSDARFIVPTGAEAVEFGPVNASIHKINEHIRIRELEPLMQVYLKTLQALLG